MAISESFLNQNDISRHKCKRHSRSRFQLACDVPGVWSRSRLTSQLPEKQHLPALWANLASHLGQENYTLGHYPQNIFGGNLDQVGYCTKVDGSLLQREIFPAPATLSWLNHQIPNSALWIGQVATAVSCKLKDTALNVCKCTTAGAKGAPMANPSLCLFWRIGEQLCQFTLQLFHHAPWKSVFHIVYVKTTVVIT